MKKIMFRLIAVIMLCFASLFIKSESSVNKIACNGAAGRVPSNQPLLKTGIIEKGIYPYDGFFTKI